MDLIAMALAKKTVEKITNLSPSDLNTITNIASTFNENEEVMEKLDTVITDKADIEHTHTSADISDLENIVAKYVPITLANFNKLSTDEKKAHTYLIT